MKGTLFSSDFIIDESDNLRLLEFNTDTGFLSSTLDSKFDFTAFINILSTNDIKEADYLSIKLELCLIGYLIFILIK